VVNAKAAQKNMGLLEAINSGKRIPGFATGGSVGGAISSSSKSSNSPSFTGNLALDKNSISVMNAFNASFSDSVRRLESIKLPEHITMEGNHKMEIILNGAEVLQHIE